MAENMNALMIEKLNQAYTAEKLALENLPKLAQAATSPSLKQAFEAHLQETRQQVARLEQAGQQIGAPVQGAPCEAVQGLAVEAERLIGQHQRGPLLDVVLVASAQAIEHHEIAAYGSMRTLDRRRARRAGHGLQDAPTGRRRPDPGVAHRAARPTSDGGHRLGTALRRGRVAAPRRRRRPCAAAAQPVAGKW
jgi:ferritin-like metal-binding protein YciE